MLYPMTFKPILKSVIWGGSDICPFKGIAPQQEGIGESWELSHVEGNYSIVDNGVLEGTDIDDLIHRYGEALLGKRVMARFGAVFPLLIKFIDARDDLSIQVHPNDALAQKRHGSFGKTEMWYVIKATESASLYSGFSRRIDGDEYVKRIENNTFMEVLKRYEVHPGDVFFLPAGRVHAIGAGCFIAEIQQTSNITYRIYDYNRKGPDGKERELHTELAKEAIDYAVYPDYRTHYEPKADAVVNLENCPYFTTNLLDLKQEMKRDFSEMDSFVIYICMEGEAVIRDHVGNEVRVHQGQTVLIPAEIDTVSILPDSKAKFMETYIS